MLVADTQKFSRGTTRAELIDKMIAQQEAIIEEVWANRSPDLPLKDINEFVTLASIVEKETGVPNERSRVAGVFINRLKKGMRLQSDPTIIYGLFGGEGKPADRPIYRSDLDKETPYNTYLIEGLPPGPIAIPGRAALEAVANPSVTEDLYFVADGTGGHVFAKTLDEHNENVRRWREIEKQRAGGSRQGSRRRCRRGDGRTAGAELRRVARGDDMTAVQSMTGFASAAGSAGGLDLTCDIRSVNNKGLDIRLRLPAGLGGARTGNQEACRRACRARQRPDFAEREVVRRRGRCGAR
jgi:hypothetical protein